MIRSEPDWWHGGSSSPNISPQLAQLDHPQHPKENLSRKTIALVGPSRASLAVNLGSLIYEIGQTGHNVICYAPELRDRAASDALAGLRAEVQGLPTMYQGFSPIADQLSIFRLAKAFRKIRPDIVAGYSPKGAVLAGLAGRLAGVQHIVAIIGELGRGFEDGMGRCSAISRQLQKTLFSVAFKLSHTAIFFNQENHKLLQQQHLLADRLRQIPVNGNGVDLRRFPPVPLPPLDRGVMFLYAGPLDRRFGIAEFCKAAQQLRTKPGHYKCLVAGPEVRGRHAFPLSTLKRYRDVIQYLGPQTDPRALMARTHVFVFPARGDIVPQALVEAVAMGRPIITSTARGCRVAVSEGVNGMIVPPGDANALAGAMARLLQRPDLIPSMSRASRQLAETEFDCRRINMLLRNALEL